MVIGVPSCIPLVPRIEPDTGWWLAIPLAIAGAGLGLLVSQLNNYTLAPIEAERISEAAGVNSAAGSFGLSFGLALAGSLMLASLAFNFTALANDSAVLPPDDKEQVAAVLERGRGSDEQHRARGAARGGAGSDPGRDHPHQQRGSAAGPAGGAAGSAAGRD